MCKHDVTELQPYYAPGPGRWNTKDKYLFTLGMEIIHILELRHDKKNIDFNSKGGTDKTQDPQTHAADAYIACARETRDSLENVIAQENTKITVLQKWTWPYMD